MKRGHPAKGGCGSKNMELGNITFDVADPAKMAAFWSAALDRPVAESSEFHALLAPDERGLNWLFLKVPETKTAKNRMHVDFHTTDREAEVARLVTLGATRHDTLNEWGVEWTVLTDPEGNEFCVGQPA